MKQSGEAELELCLTYVDHTTSILELAANDSLYELHF